MSLFQNVSADVCVDTFFYLKGKEIHRSKEVSTKWKKFIDDNETYLPRICLEITPSILFGHLCFSKEFGLPDRKFMTYQIEISSKTMKTFFFDKFDVRSLNNETGKNK